jgi:acyl-CoA synthetase (AMP-forming)/AMP-acid ligase II
VRKNAAKRRRERREVGDERKPEVRTDPGGWLTRLDDAMIARYEGDGAWAGRTIADWLESAAAAAPDKPLIIDGIRTLSAREARDRALRLARLFADRGLKPGDVVSFQLPNWHETILIDLACACGGFVSNPIVPIYRDAEVDFILRDAKSRLFFIPETFRGFDYVAMSSRVARQLPNAPEIIVVRPAKSDARSFDAFSAAEPRGRIAAPDANAVKLLMYTSGTTGPAKGVLHTHNTLGAEIANFIRWMGLSADDVTLMASPLTHITGYLYGHMLPITLGATGIIMDVWNAGAAADIIERHSVTFTLGATPFLQELAAVARTENRPFPSLRYFPTGGAPVPPEVIHDARRSFARAVSFRIYGSTEAPTVALGVPDPAKAELAATTEGFIVGHEIKLVDDGGRSVPDGAEGEIVSRGPENCVGYANWNDNDGAFDADGFFHTGDLGRMTPEGCIVITGRKKDLIIRGGENLSPKEIEDVLYTHPAIREAAVVAMPHARLGETACAFVVLRDGAAFDFAEMTRLFETSGLARQKFPERLEVVDELPHTSAGKVRKNLLRDEIARRVSAAR